MLYRIQHLHGYLVPSNRMDFDDKEQCLVIVVIPKSTMLYPDGGVFYLVNVEYFHDHIRRFFIHYSVTSTRVNDDTWRFRPRRCLEGVEYRLVRLRFSNNIATRILPFSTTVTFKAASFHRIYHSASAVATSTIWCFRWGTALVSRPVDGVGFFALWGIMLQCILRTAALLPWSS